MKSIESFQLFLEQEYVFVLTGNLLKANPAFFNDINHIKSILAANNHHPVYLVSAAFQLELAHHFDDALSKETAYRHSTQAAQATTLTPADIMQMFQASAVAYQGLNTRVVNVEYVVSNNLVRRDEHEALIAENAALKKDLEYIQAEMKVMGEESLTPPVGWLTAYTFIKDLVGPEKSRYRYLLPQRGRSGAELGYLEYLACTVLRERDTQPRNYRVAGQKFLALHFPYDVIDKAFQQYKGEAEHSKPHILRNIPSPLRYITREQSG